MPHEDRFVTAREIAALLSLPVSWVREHTRTGEIPCLRFGRYVRYVPSEVLGWGEEQRAGASPSRARTTNERGST